MLEDGLHPYYNEEVEAQPLGLLRCIAIIRYYNNKVICPTGIPPSTEPSA